LSKTTIEIEVIQCDHVDETGQRCTKEGPRESIGSCRVCGIDVCDNHSDLTSVTSRVLDMLVAGQTRDVYCFCIEHMDDLVKLVIEKFGDRYEIPPSYYGGFPGATGTPNAKPIFFNKPSNIKQPI
jgi:hypothetical protein